LPRQELLPEKRHLFMPTLHEVCAPRPCETASARAALFVRLWRRCEFCAHHMRRPSPRAAASQIVGSDLLRQRVERLRPGAHCFGHTHFAWDQTLDDGTRYLSWPLGTPQEQARRVPYAPDADACKKWLPSPIWDARTGWAADTDNCYFSDLYKTKGRHVERFEMAMYTAAIYCPDAPIDPMIPSNRGQNTLDDVIAAESSLKGQVNRGQRMVGAAVAVN
jgi:hypothetical protein